ncbi:MAG: lysophospholipase, partial [Pseudomonadota bacterium]|nr:lysophospholipase [Pseudomonadota bacterium]
MIGRWCILACATVLVTLSACAPTLMTPGPIVGEARLTDDAFVTADGARLPLRKWMPETGQPKVIILALHGFNDYSNFFSEPGLFLSQRGIGSYAYDQRGFGRAPHPSYWAGTAAMVADVKALTHAVRVHHPGLPFYLLGESMGAAVIMVAMTEVKRPKTEGVILAAPAVWGRATMPWYQRWALWFGGHTVPWLTVSGRGLGIKPSDNIEMLNKLSRDPLVIKDTRIDTLYGLVNLMDAALERATTFQAPALILYGERDEIIPREPTARMLERLPAGPVGRRQIAIYEDGYHMLLRDLQASTLWRDISQWIRNPG